MGKDWFDNFKPAQLAFEEASDFTGLKLRKLCFDGTDSDLKATEITQPAILTVTAAMFRSLATLGEIKTSEHLFAGHSLGEYSALVCTGAIDIGPAARLVKRRGEFMQQAVPAGHGSMAALIFKPKTDGAARALALCERIRSERQQKVWVANFNSPEQIVVSGEKLAIASVLELATTEPTLARKAVELAVSAPFHCPLMQPAALKMQEELKTVEWRLQPPTHYVANVDAEVHALDDGAGISARLEQQVTASVRWVESVQAAIRQGCTEAIEIGPGKVLTGLVRRIELDGRTLETKNIDLFKEFQSSGISI